MTKKTLGGAIGSSVDPSTVTIRVRIPNTTSTLCQELLLNLIMGFEENEKNKKRLALAIFKELFSKKIFSFWR